MKSEAQRIAIAEACGWTAVREDVEHYRATGDHESPCLLCGYRKDGLYWRVPDYLNDLDAMHEAEATLTGETNYYHQLLIRMNNYDGLATVRATAAQRAEAFLRTIGRWEDSQ